MGFGTCLCHMCLLFDFLGYKWSIKHLRLSTPSPNPKPQALSAAD